MASYTDLDICNIALHSIGAKALEFMGEDSKGGRACNSFFGFTRDFLLSSFDWSFARKFAKLDVLMDATDPTEYDLGGVPTGYYKYQLPSDCEIVRKLWPYKQRDNWEIFGDKLYASRAEDVGIYYTTKEVNTYLFSTAFSNILALGIAVRLAPIMAQDDTLAQKLYEQFLIDQQTAFAIDANAGNPYREYDETPEKDTFVNPDLAGFFGV